MKNIIIKLGKSIFLQIIAFSIIVGGVAFAAIQWPTSAPVSEIVGGKFQGYFINIFKSCPSGQVITGHTSNGTLICGYSAITTQTRNDAGLSGASGATSGFFQTLSPTNYPTGATSWWHLIDSRHTNNSNNYSLQIAGSFSDQNLWFRKTNNNASQLWSKIVAENQSGNVGIGTSTPSAKLEVNGNIKTTSLDVNGTITSNYLQVNRTDSVKEGGEIALMNSNTETNRDGRIILDNYDQKLRIFRWKANPGEYTEYGVFEPTKTYIGMQGNVGIGTSTPSAKLEVNGQLKVGTTTTSTQKISTDGNMSIRNSGPTIYLRDTDQRSAMLHVNSNWFYLLRGNGSDSESWVPANGWRPMTINLENNNSYFGGDMTVNGTITASNPTASNQVATKAYVDDNKINTNALTSIQSNPPTCTGDGYSLQWNGISWTCNSTSLGGYIEKYINTDEDTYTILSNGNGLTDTCNYGQNEFKCPINITKSCNDLIVTGGECTGGGEGGYCTPIVNTRQHVTCVARKMLVKDNTNPINQVTLPGVPYCYPSDTRDPNCHPDNITALKYCKMKGYTNLDGYSSRGWNSPGDNGSYSWNGSTWVHKSGYDGYINSITCY